MLIEAERSIRALEDYIVKREYLMASPSTDQVALMYSRNGIN